MLDALKFAFEILIVGALTMPWLILVIHILIPDRPVSMTSYLSPFPEASQGVLVGVLLLAFGYVAGSAVSRISRDLFNDEMFGSIPSEDSIRNSVYYDEYCKQNVIANSKSLPYDDSVSSQTQSDLKVAFCAEGPEARPVDLSATAPSETAEGHQDKKSQAIREMFSLQEGELLLLGQDKVDRLKQYYDQITVLRGAAANSLMLFMVCVFGSCANFKVRVAGSLKLVAYLPSVAVLALGNYSLLSHVRVPGYHLANLYVDPPLAESVVILVGMLGFIMVLKAKQPVVYPKAGVLAAVLFIICFEGWWWTEVMYDLHIIHSQTELHSHLGEAQPLKSRLAASPSRAQPSTDIAPIIPLSLPARSAPAVNPPE